MEEYITESSSVLLDDAVSLNDVPLVDPDTQDFSGATVAEDPAQCSSISPNGVMRCQLNEHSDAVLHRFMWYTLDGPRVEYW